MEINRLETAADERAADAKTYSAPALKVFGPVGALTQGGTNMVGEMINMMGVPTMGMMML